MESNIIYVFPTCFIIKYLQVHHKDWPEKLESMSLKSSYILLYWPVIYNSSFFVRKVESNIRVMSIHSILNDINSAIILFSQKLFSLFFNQGNRHVSLNSSLQSHKLDFESTALLDKLS